MSRRSFRGTTAFYFARMDSRLRGIDSRKGGVKATGVAGFGCDGEGQQ